MKVSLISDSIFNREEGKKGGVMVFKFEKVEDKIYCIQIIKNEVRKEQIQIPLSLFQKRFLSFLLKTFSSYLPLYYTSSFKSFIPIEFPRIFFKKAMKIKSNSTAKIDLE